MDGWVGNHYYGWWILDEHDVPQRASGLEAARWREQNPHRWKLAHDALPGGTVSTVFLPLDHQFGDGPPLLYETMVLYPGTFRDFYCERYATRDEALAGHARVVEEVCTGALRAPPLEDDEIPVAFLQAFEEDDRG